MSFSEKLKGFPITQEARDIVEAVEAFGFHWIGGEIRSPKPYFVGIRLLPDRYTIISASGDDYSRAICLTYQGLLIRLPELSRWSSIELPQQGNQMEKFILSLKETLKHYDRMERLAINLCVSDIPTQERIEQFRLMLRRQSAPRLDLFGLSVGNVRGRFSELLNAHKDYAALADKLSRVPRWLRWLFGRQYRNLALMREMYSPGAFMIAVMEEGERRMNENENGIV